MATTEIELADISRTQTRSTSPEESLHVSTSSGKPLTEDLLLASNLPPVDYGRGVWEYAISACVIESLVWGFAFAFGTFQEYYLSEPPFNSSSTASISAIGTISLALMYFGTLFFIPLFRRYPEWAKPLMIAGLVATVLAYLISSFATKVWQLILLQGILTGVSGGMIYSPLLLWLNEWTDKRRGLIGGIMFAGTGIGGAVSPLLVSTLLDTVGFHWTLRIWAAIVGVLMGVALIFCKPRIPPRAMKGQARAPFMPVSFSFLTSPVFWLFSSTIVLQSLSFIPISLYIPTYSTSLGLSRLDGNIALSLFNASSVVSQFAVGWLCDKRSYSMINAVSCTGASLVAFLLFGLAAKQLATVLVFALLFGFIAGGFSSTWPAAAKQSAGRNQGENGLVFSLFGSTKGITSIVGPLIAAELYRPTTSRSDYGAYGFDKLIIFCGVTMMGAAACGLSTAAYSKKVRYTGR